MLVSMAQHLLRLTMTSLFKIRQVQENQGILICSDNRNLVVAVEPIYGDLTSTGTRDQPTPIQNRRLCAVTTMIAFRYVVSRELVIARGGMENCNRWRASEVSKIP